MVHPPKDGRYAVIECLNCGRYLALDCKIGFKKCPYCGYVNKINSSRIVKKFKSPKDASELIRFLNSSTNEDNPFHTPL